MPDKQSRRSRYTVEDSLSSLRFAIKGRRNWPVVIFLGIWLLGWAAGEVTVTVILLGQLPDLSGDGWFLLFWLTFWTVGGALALRTWLRALAGREIVEVDALTLSVKQSVLGIGRRKEYAAPYVDSLRVEPYHSSSSAVPPGHCLAFDYGEDTVRFGTTLNKADAEEILALIRSRFPDLTKDVDEV